MDLEPITEHEFQSDTCITTGMRQPPSSSALPFDVCQHQRAKPSCVRSTPILQPHTAESQSSVEDGLHCLLSPTSVASTATVLGMQKVDEGKGVKVRFRRSALREYYGRSVNSPNLATGGVRRSPRLAGTMYMYTIHVLYIVYLHCTCTIYMYCTCMWKPICTIIERG